MRWATDIRRFVRRSLRRRPRVLHVSNLFYHEYQSALAERLTRLSGLDRAFFCNSGTEAWEGALKLARAYAQRRAKKASREAGMALSGAGELLPRPHLGLRGHHGHEEISRAFRAADSRGQASCRFNDVADLRGQV